MEELLYAMLDTLKDHKRATEELDLYYINKRLNTSLQNYYADLSTDTEYLEAREETNLVRKLNKNL